MLTIEVRLLSQQAIAQARALQSQLNGMKGSLASSAGGATNLNQAFAFSNLEKFGKNLQWTGRQLEFNFTLPLLLAGGAATKFALDNETAFTTVRKAYGAFDGDAQTVNAELKELRKSFELLSDRFGIHQKEVLTIAADWAQAGAAGVGLAKAVRLTLETMILGQEDAKTATTDLLTIQSAYRLNTDQLRQSLVTLNAVQVTTAIDFGGLVDAVSRSAGIARDAGIDIQHLAAMIAALVPATGSAAAGGNALRTIISRVMAPTKQAAEEMQLFGINITDATWQAKDGVQRLEALAQAYVGLSDAQKVQVASIVGSRWQVNRLDILLNDLNSTTGVYAKALNVSSDAQKANTVYAQQLATVLSSTPQGFKILTTNIQNALSKAILPLLPALTALLGHIVGLVNGFTNLDPNIQQLILSFLVLLAAVGPVTRYIGSFTLLFTTLGKLVGFTSMMLFGMSDAELAMLSSTELADVGLIHQYGLLGLLGIGLKNIFTLFGLIPFLWSGFTAALDLGLSLLGKTVAYLSGPFLAAVADAGVWLARSLPVAASVAAAGVSKAFMAVAALPGLIASAFSYAWAIILGDINILSRVWEALIVFMEEAWAAMQEFIAGFPAFMRSVWFTVVGITDIALASMEGTIAGFTTFLGMIPEMIGAAFASPWILVGAAIVAFIIIFRDQIGEAIQWVINAFNRLPAGVVNAFRQLVEIVKNVALKVRDWLSHINPFARHSPSLVDQVQAGTAVIGQHYQNLQAVPETVQAAADAHKNFNAATSDLSGDKVSTKAANIIQAQPGSADAVNGMVKAMDDLRGAVASVNSELTKQQTLVDDMQRQIDQDMKPFNDAIDANDLAQKKLRLEMLKMGDAGKTIDDLKSKMADLAGEIEGARSEQADLRTAGAGSDILKQYDDQINALQRQSSAIEGQVAPVQALQDQLDKLRVEGEKLQLQKDIQFDPQLKALDEQKSKVTELNSAYSDLNSQLSSMESDFNSMAAAAKAANDAAAQSLNADQFAAAAGANFQDVGGDTIPGLGKEGDLADIQKFNDDLQKELDAALANMGGFDMFAPLKDAWNATWGWIKDNVGPLIKPVTDAISNGFNSVGFDWSWDGVTTALGNIDKLLSESTLSGAWKNIKEDFSVSEGMFKRVFDAILPPLKEIGGWFADAGRSIGGELKKWGELAAPAVEAFTHIYNVVSWVVTEVAKIISFILVTVILPLWQLIWPILLNVIKPIFDGIVGVIRGALEIIRGVIGFVLNLINGDWGKAWDSVKTIFAGVWDTFYAIVSVPLGLVYGLIKGVIEDIVGIFQWLYDILLGHSIIPDLFDGIAAVWNVTGKPVFDGIAWIINNVVIPAFGFLRDGVLAIWNFLWPGMKVLWDTVGAPIFSTVSSIVQGLIPAFQTVADVIKGIFSGIWDGMKWAWDNVGSKIFDGITWTIGLLKTAFQGAASFISGVWDGITGAIRTAANFFIDAYNAIAGAINSVLDFLHLPTIPGNIGHVGGNPSNQTTNRNVGVFAEGGVLEAMTAAGGITSQIRAIVGEGSNIYPEYVIPTDPQYRRNALSLMGDLQTKLFMADGGITYAGIGDFIGGLVAGPAAPAAGLVNQGFQAAWDLVNNAIDIVNRIQEPIRSLGSEMINDAVSWIQDRMDTALSGGIDVWKNATGPGRILDYLGLHEGGIIPALANGGIVLPRPGGTLVRLGEAGRAEAVQPLPNNLGGDTINNFYGDLSFPNITKPEDAGKFLANLQSVSSQ